jgi:hypothetical protein
MNKFNTGNEFNSGIGLGLFIYKIENNIIQFIISVYKFISKLIVQKYRIVLNFVVNTILSKHNLNIFSKGIILTTMLIILMKLLARYITAGKKNLKKITSIPLMFFNDKKVPFNKESNIRIIKKDINYEKINKFIECQNSKRNKYNLNTESINEPFFRLVKYYMTYGSICKRKNDSIN